jgi:hypothetical protein
MEEAPENSKELSHSAHGNGMEYNSFVTTQKSVVLICFVVEV